MDAAIRAFALRSQRSEMTEHIIYARLARRAAGKNREVLTHISNDELRHYEFWKKISGEEVSPRRPLIWFYLFLARVFGVIFAVKLMERGEGDAQAAYGTVRQVPGVERLIADEHHHETQLLNLLKEERLEYAGSLVLGLNDALVELTGALAGFTFALQDSRVVALAGIIMGVAAALSMSASGYLSSKEEADQNSSKSPLKAAMYTGVAYLLTVFILVAPFFLLSSIYTALGLTLLLAILIIAAYTFYITTAKDQPFFRRFFEMAAISVAVAIISFGIGWAAKTFLGVQV